MRRNEANERNDPGNRRGIEERQRLSVQILAPTNKIQRPAISLHRSNHSEFCFSRCYFCFVGFRDKRRRERTHEAYFAASFEFTLFSSHKRQELS